MRQLKTIHRLIMIDDMNKPLLTIAICCIGIGLSLSYMILSVRADDIKSHCRLPFATYNTIDLTDLLIGSYLEYHHNGYNAKWHELQNSINAVIGERADIIGFYDFNGSWGIVWYTSNGQYAIMLGDNWQLDDYKQLHSPICYIVLSADYANDIERYFVTDNYWRYIQYIQDRYNIAHNLTQSKIVL